LELDLAPPEPAPKPAPPAARPAPAPPAPAPKGPASPLDYFGTGFEEDPRDAAADAAIELESYRPPSAEGPLAPAEPSDAPPLPRGTLGPKPSTTPTATVSADDRAASVLASYGPAPTAIYLAPVYAYRVFVRQRQLRREIVGVNARYEEAEARRDELLADLARARRATIEGDARFEASLAAVRQLEQIAGERGAALSQTNQSLEDGRRELGTQLETAREQTEARHAIEKNAIEVVANAEQEANRAQAKQKRVLIEARAAARVAQQTAGGPDAPIAPEHAVRIHDLETQAAAMQPEVTARQQELVAAQTELANIRREIAALATHVRRIQDQERALSRKFQGDLVKQSAGVSSAEKELRSALAAVGRALVEARDGVEPAALEAVAALERQVKETDESRALHLRALDVYDRDAVKRGVGLTVAAVALLVLGLFALALFR
jgi:predicted  nucleic acid-binding Zn-ribbon protein